MRSFVCTVVAYYRLLLRLLLNLGGDGAYLYGGDELGVWALLVLMRNMPPMPEAKANCPSQVFRRLDMGACRCVRAKLLLYNALVWMTTHTEELCAKLEADGGKDRFRAKTGLPVATYFSASKIRWILDNVPGALELAESGNALFGNTDSWLVWNLTGGPDGGQHITDVTNASRTQLMNLTTLDWDEELLSDFGIPRSMLP